MEESNPYTAPQVIDVTAPSESTGMPPLASLGQRFLGALVDGIIMLVLIVIVFMLLGGFFVVSGAAGGIDTVNENLQKADTSFLGTVIMTLIGFGLTVAVQGKFWADTGQSIGKKLVGTRIVNLDGTQADFNTIAFKRLGIMTAIGIVPVVGGLVNLVNILLVFRAERNCLHDDIAKTRVVIFEKSA